MKKIVYLLVGGILAMTILSGCEGQERKKVEEQLSDFTSLYPMEDLTEFYDLEGYRDEDFAEDDKGTWIINSGYTYSMEDKLESHSITLFFNRNTKQANGSYYYRTLYDDSTKDTEVKIPVYYSENGIQVIGSEEIPKELKNLNFLLHYIDLSKSYLSNLNLDNARFDSKTELYSVKYLLNKEDRNLKDIEKKLNIESGDNPSLTIEGSGDELKADREIRFDLDSPKNYKVSESIIFSSTIEQN